MGEGVGMKEIMVECIISKERIGGGIFHEG